MAGHQYRDPFANTGGRLYVATLATAAAANLHNPKGIPPVGGLQRSGSPPPCVYNSHLTFSLSWRVPRINLTTLVLPCSDIES
jgi:hypothetical protein